MREEEQASDGEDADEFYRVGRDAVDLGGAKVGAHDLARNAREPLALARLRDISLDYRLIGERLLRRVNELLSALERLAREIREWAAHALNPEPRVVAAEICELVRRPRREVVIPRQHYAIAWLEQMLPSLADRAHSWRHWSPVE